MPTNLKQDILLTGKFILNCIRIPERPRPDTSIQKEVDYIK